MMCGYLLARAGIDVIVIEKHGDFLRDFRGDTVHPSTLELIYELGLLSAFLRLPHQEVSKLGAQIGTRFITLADFSYLPTKCKFLAFMPQWDFLDFLADKAKQLKSFSLRMNTEAIRLREHGERVIGVVAKTADGELSIMADLVIAADGRNSIMRQSAKLEVEDIGAPIDVLWMRLSRKKSDPPQTFGRVDTGVFFIMLNREQYWQCGFLIPKDTLEKYKEEGMENFRERIAKIAPFTSNRVNELKSWDDIKLLTVKIDRLKKWYRNGFLCIGDAAHAMSPVGGVGINLAIQDAVAAANILYAPLLRGSCSEEDLKSVQQRRMRPTRMTQRLQVAIQNRVIKPTLEGVLAPSVPWIGRLINGVPLLRGIPAATIGIGFRAEHIHTPDARQTR
jgi:2-polyprenyl-6-methoxyphenol hydroxylase-like FAD-dependent oxidoreductase